MNATEERGATAEEMVPSTKILVGVSLNAQLSRELLSWAITVAARPNDSVIALHVLVLGKDEKKVDCVAAYKTKLRRAKTFVISMLGEFTELCQSKQVKLEAKVWCDSGIGKGLVQEAASLEASFLLLGSSRNRSHRLSLGVTKYCFQHAPRGCSTVAIRKQGLLSCQDQDLEQMTYEAGKALAYLQKLFHPKTNRASSFRKNKEGKRDEQSAVLSISSDKSLSSPKGPTNQEGLTHGNFQINGSSSTPHCSRNRTQTNYRSNIWKHLSPIKLLIPFVVRSAFQEYGESKVESVNGQISKPSWRCFSYEEISQATNNFHPENIVGTGGYAQVYRGNLQDGQTIAVKRLAKDSTDEHKEREFLTELGIIGHVCHPNTAYLIGCCIDNGLHLIFDFSPRGSLASVLHGKNSALLEWPIRHKIVMGVARGLHYLHKCCKHRIIHRDIKASNVLLGPDFEPQISDFGLAKWLPRQWTHHSVTPIEGTFGYLAPEYFMHGIVDEKTDVFAFGVLLLEILTGRKPVDTTKQSLLLWAKPLIDSGNVVELADPKLEGRYDMDQIQRLVLTASYCVRQSSIWRPSMNEVLQLLTDGYNCKAAKSWRRQDYMIDEVDEYITEVDCQFPPASNTFEDYP